MKAFVPKGLLERLNFGDAHDSYSILVCPGPSSRTPYQVVKPGTVKYRVEIRPEGYIVVITR
ncbi:MULTISPECIES: hypothetical protein [Burkholderia cepacia complex]|uniref:hypothetical protein n=1 Tax=Burkholderia cepacia complex TaxID=87882 RepID=UPI00097C3E6A|nr:MULTISPECIES: hypothetical protein [Burkholderia cepacia complex]MBR8246564.1 hypothetical protein [Burkholderia cenocepacia]MBR8288518.1 hypothetical protein [Burkholderia cenocepacia]MBR8501988.1 hypothetical protein [Burkholderia cenocepacia]MCA8037372.1 hypothetical protein [Burkholderia arboris]ONJ13474.1 hypothetical protein A8D83_10825 [Burkholderia cenocepacia]